MLRGLRLSIKCNAVCNRRVELQVWLLKTNNE